MIGLPRNMQNVPFDEDSPLREVYPDGFTCGDECLLNAVYQQGEEHADAYPDNVTPGVEAMKEAVGGVTGLEVQYHAMIDLKGFEDLIDAMGGITVVAGKRVPISSGVDPNTGQHGPVKGWIEEGEPERVVAVQVLLALLDPALDGSVLARVRVDAGGVDRLHL